MKNKNPQSERYSRNILVPEIGKFGQDKLFSAKVLVCGAGGLGSGVISNLASLGVGKIGIVDNDTVEASNLNRQYIHKVSSTGKPKVESAKSWIEAYNPNIEVETFSIRLNPENYAKIVDKYDIIADCFDSFTSKFLLNDISLKTSKPLVHAGVSGFQGQIMTIIPHKTACLRCIFPDAPLETPVFKGVLSPTVSVAASIQSMEILKLIIGENQDTETLLTNKMLTFNGLNIKFKTLNLHPSSTCVCTKA